MSKLLALPVIVVLLLALGTIAGACGGGEKLTLDEYFQELEAILDESVEKNDALAPDFAKEFEERDFEGLREVYDRSLENNRDAFDERMDDIDPPAEAEDAHNELVEAGSAFWDILEDFVDQLEDVETITEFEAAVKAMDDAWADGPAERIAAACSAVEEIATDNDIDADLNCS